MSQLENPEIEAPLVEVAVPEVVPVGLQLQAAREALGYSIGDVSQVLKFSPKQIEALEQSDFSLLKGNTFLRGFVRSYARFLHLDDSVLLSQLQQAHPVQTLEVHAVESMGAEMPERSSVMVPHRVRTALAGSLALLAVIGGLAYAYFAGWLALPQATYEKDAEVAAVKVAPVVPSGETLSNITPPAVQVLPDAASSLAPAQVSAPSLQPVSVPLAPDERQLTLTFSGDSWVEVRDARQEIVLTGKFNTGSQQFARGKAPFQVVIGNAAVVKLRYEDKQIDLQPFTRAEVARMTLDDNSK